MALGRGSSIKNVDSLGGGVFAKRQFYHLLTKVIFISKSDHDLEGGWGQTYQKLTTWYMDDQVRYGLKRKVSMVNDLVSLFGVKLIFKHAFEK